MKWEREEKVGELIPNKMGEKEREIRKRKGVGNVRNRDRTESGERVYKSTIFVGVKAASREKLHKEN